MIGETGFARERRFTHKGRDYLLVKLNVTQLSEDGKIYAHSCRTNQSLEREETTLNRLLREGWRVHSFRSEGCNVHENPLLFQKDGTYNYDSGLVIMFEREANGAD
jgi:hypothetical protein